ncbi:hypothetical protein ACIP9C_17395 [Lysinibacillus sp. NPDC093210]|uniref:hypothetical protein n=1 Tax=Lysinibacillus sp. NPDC093210 TaxID=3364133 RepID=UPI003821E76D
MDFKLLRAFIDFPLSSNGIEGNYADLFSKIISSPIEAILLQGLFLLLTIAIVSGGIKGGIEKASTWMMPLCIHFLHCVSYPFLNT